MFLVVKASEFFSGPQTVIRCVSLIILQGLTQPSYFKRCLLVPEVVVFLWLVHQIMNLPNSKSYLYSLLDLYLYKLLDLILSDIF